MNTQMLSKKILLFVLLCLPWATGLQAQVWPGDINNNGIVNHVDVLFFGQAHQYAGPPREASQQGIFWGEKDLPAPWGLEFPGGLDYSYADCNGDGFVDAADFLAIDFNYGQTHDVLTPDPSSNGTPGFDPKLYFVNTFGPVLEGAFIPLEVYLGTPNNPVTDFYGIAFSINFDPELFSEDFNIGFITSGWIQQTGGGQVEYAYAYPDDGRIDIAITRTNGTPIPEGYGQIGAFFIVIEDNVVGLSEEGEETNLFLNNILLVDQNMAVKKAVGDTLTMLIEDNDLINSTQEQTKEPSIQLSPVPTDDLLQIKSGDAQIQTIRLFNAVGQCLEHQSIDQEMEVMLDTRTYPNGYYWLEIQTKSGKAIKPFSVQH